MFRLRNSIHGRTLFRSICRLLFLLLLALALFVILARPRSRSSQPTVQPEAALRFFQQAQSDRWFNASLEFSSDDKIIAGDQLLSMDGPFIKLYGAGRDPCLILNAGGHGVSFIDQLYCLGQDLYLSERSIDSTVLFRYSVETQELQRLCQVPCSRFWAVQDKDFIYLEARPFAEQDKAPLHLYDLTSGEDLVVCDEVSSFGMVDGTLRFVSFREEESAYAVMDYDRVLRKAVRRGTIPAAFGLNCRFQYTPEKILMARYGNEIFNFDYDPSLTWKLAVYDLESDALKIFDLPSELQELHAVNAFAYAEVYHVTGGSGFGIYRICLENGEVENITPELDSFGVVQLWTSSDDCVYLMNYHVYSQARGALYRWDVQTGRYAFLCWIDEK